MKQPIFDFDNIGGICKLYAIPLSSFLRIRKDYGADTDHLEVKQRESIIELTVWGEGFDFVEEHINDARGDGYEISISGFIPKISANKHIVETLERGEWLVLFQDSNGDVKLSGQEEIPMKFMSKKTTGKTYASFNNISFSFSCVQPDPSVNITLSEYDLI